MTGEENDKLGFIFECRVQNWDSNFNLETVGATIGRPHNQTRGIVSFGETERAV